MKATRILAGFFLVLIAGVALAQGAPNLMTYQGRLTDETGLPVDGSREMHFAFLDGDTSTATVLWGETQAGVLVDKGIYHVILGGVNPIYPSVLTGSTVYLEVKVGGEVLAPRQRLTSVPFAMNAAALEARLAALEALLANVTKVGDDMYFTGVNVHVRNGSGATDGDTNGLGNLIVGYNEDSGDTRTGSHNLIIGPYHSYSSFGGLIAGYNNNVSGIFSSVSGGYLNTASGNRSSVSGGALNTASNTYSSVSGGEYNVASGEWAASVCGGYTNTASGDYSSVSGGYLNTASGEASSVSGGEHNTASGFYSMISAGRYNLAMGQYSSVSGGGGATAEFGNLAFSDYSCVSGGSDNTAAGNYSTVSGGLNRLVGTEYDWAACDTEYFCDQ